MKVALLKFLDRDGVLIQCVIFVDNGEHKVLLSVLETGQFWQVEVNLRAHELGTLLLVYF
jgi:hypothetical protein